jgi:hypothetical protein
MLRDAFRPTGVAIAMANDRIMLTRHDLRGARMATGDFNDQMVGNRRSGAGYDGLQYAR